MFLRKLKNRSGSVSIQIISKAGRKYKVVKTIGCARGEQEMSRLWLSGKQELERLQGQSRLFVSSSDTLVDQAFSVLENASVRTVRPDAGRTTSNC